MDLIADIILGIGCVGAAAYCYLLSSRLKSFNNLETGMGGAVAVLSLQVDEMTSALKAAQMELENSRLELNQLTERAEKAQRSLNIEIAALHDLEKHTSAQSESIDETVDKANPLSPDLASKSEMIQPLFIRHRAN